MSRIILFEAENFQRIKVMRFKPDKHLVVIGGPNRAGKTTALNAVDAAIGGKAACPEVPIRTGERNAHVMIVIGEDRKPLYKVERRWKLNGETELNVWSADGRPITTKTQDLLDGLRKTLTYKMDLLGFFHLKVPEQAALLREIGEIDTTALDAEYASKFEERTALGRELKALVGAVDQAPVHFDAPEREIKLSDIAAELQAAEGHNRQVAASISTADECDRDVERAMRDVQAAGQAVEAAEAALARARQAQEATETALGKARTLAAAQRKVADGQGYVDTAPIQRRIADAEGLNAKYRADQERTALVRQRDAKQADVDALTARLTAIKDAKAAMLRDAKIPVPGLTIEEDGAVLYNGLPLAQASGYEQIKVSMQIAAAQGPNLRIGRIDYGSELDDNGLADVERIAEEMDIQVWMNRVGKGAEVKIVLEDGEIAEDRTVQTEPDAAPEPTPAPAVTGGTLPLDADPLDSGGES